MNNASSIPSTMPVQEAAHLQILKILEQQPDITQRDLATQIGLSLGKTNFLLKALIDKGLVKIGNFQRAESKQKKIVYLLTPAGIGEKIRLTRNYLSRKEAEYQALKVEIELLRQEEKHLATAVPSQQTNRSV